MQTLGISDSTVRTEGRLKSLFWPSIQTGADVDYLGAGFWVCTIVAILSFVLSLTTGHPVSGFFVFLVFYLGGVGVRERSRFAAGMVLLTYAADALLSLLFMGAFPGLGVVKVVIIALLISNRATWIASAWKPEAEEVRCRNA